MKTLALYASKYGCTDDCVKHLKNKLGHESIIINLKKGASADLE